MVVAAIERSGRKLRYREKFAAVELGMGWLASGELFLASLERLGFHDDELEELQRRLIVARTLPPAQLHSYCRGPLLRARRSIRESRP
ncbi:MAG: hypothetical protein ABMA13_01185 [Chthoniobacteraceae bacterium]